MSRRFVSQNSPISKKEKLEGRHAEKPEATFTKLDAAAGRKMSKQPDTKVKVKDMSEFSHELSLVSTTSDPIPHKKPKKHR